MKKLILVAAALALAGCNKPIHEALTPKLIPVMAQR